ncbi:hypothetical protein [Streptomyces sp. CC53]|uniref:hypothetical protein n=1 Tax=Streptomyces sp. CC53 TaxID=1906740 RepID=UPI0015A4F255|nr:hypothetical protein [Streptomyces sp. CC53]
MSRSFVFRGEAVDEAFRVGCEGRARGPVGVQGVEDDGHVDAFLEQRARGGR